MCLIGAGFAPIYAASLLWTEDAVVVSSKVVALFSMVTSLGSNMFPIVAGQVIEENPAMLAVILLAVILLCVCIFAASAGFANFIKKGQDEVESESAETEGLIHGEESE